MRTHRQIIADLQLLLAQSRETIARQQTELRELRLEYTARTSRYETEMAALRRELFEAGRELFKAKREGNRERGVLRHQLEMSEAARRLRS